MLTAEFPVFPITINGNRFDESMKRAKDASTTNNIFVQSRGSFRLSARYRGWSCRRRSQALWLRIQNHILVLCTPPPYPGNRSHEGLFQGQNRPWWPVMSQPSWAVHVQYNIWKFNLLGNRLIIEIYWAWEFAYVRCRWRMSGFVIIPNKGSVDEGGKL